LQSGWYDDDGYHVHDRDNNDPRDDNVSDDYNVDDNQDGHHADDDDESRFAWNPSGASRERRIIRRLGTLSVESTRHGHKGGATEAARASGEERPGNSRFAGRQ
jgi:hypothetical protein